MSGGRFLAARAVAQIDPKDGSTVAVYMSISDAAASVGLPNNGRITDACRYGYRGAKAGGYMWIYVAPKDNRGAGTPVVRIDPVTLRAEAVYQSISDAAEMIGRTSGAISKCCDGKTQVCGGWYWRRVMGTHSAVQLRVQATKLHLLRRASEAAKRFSEYEAGLIEKSEKAYRDTGRSRWDRIMADIAAGKTDEQIEDKYKHLGMRPGDATVYRRVHEHRISRGTYGTADDLYAGALFAGLMGTCEGKSGKDVIKL